MPLKRLLRPILVCSLICLLATLAWVTGRKFWYAPIVHRTSTPSTLTEFEAKTASVMQTFVSSNGFVDYTGLKMTADKLDQALSHAAGLHTHNLNRRQKLSWWINTYNLLTLKGILEFWPTTSIRNHVNPLGFYFYRDVRLQTRTEVLSPHIIEHELLRKMEDPRIHFAIVCASKGCPILFNDAYRFESIDKQLEAAARKFFASPQNFRLNHQTVALNPILKWFKEDFGDSKAELLQTISPWLPEPLPEPQSIQIQWLDYDWSINAQAKAD